MLFLLVSVHPAGLSDGPGQPEDDTERGKGTQGRGGRWKACGARDREWGFVPATTFETKICERSEKATKRKGAGSNSPEGVEMVMPPFVLREAMGLSSKRQGGREVRGNDQGGPEGGHGTSTDIRLHWDLP